MSGTLYTDLPLDPSKHMLRLWRFSDDFDPAYPLQLELESFTENTCPAYIALSYVWGDESVTEAIVVNGHTLHVTANLCIFLQRLRVEVSWENTRKRVGLYCQPDWFFADQISINQNAVSERNHQVSLMGRIYSDAQKTFAWLGDFAGDQLYACKRSTCLAHPDHPMHNDKSLLLDPGTATYWMRLWVVQEVFLANDLSFWYGYHKVRASVLHSKLYDLVDSLDKSVSDEGKEALASRFKYTFWPKINKLLSVQGNGASQGLLQALSRYAECECTDPRDKVFGLQAMVLPPQRVQVDYSMSTSNLTKICVMKLIRHGELSFGTWSFLGGFPSSFAEPIKRINRILISCQLNVIESESSYAHGLLWASSVPRVPATIENRDVSFFRLDDIPITIAELATTEKQKAFAAHLHNQMKSCFGMPAALHCQQLFVGIAEKLGMKMFSDFLCHPDEWEYEDRSFITLDEYYIRRRSDIYELYDI